MENKTEFKPFDKVLVRDNKEDIWRIDLFERYLPDYNHPEYNICNYICLRAAWEECIPYKGNEHLLGTSETPEITDLGNNILFGIELKVGYVLEFEDEDVRIAGIIIPAGRKELAVSYLKYGWDYLKNISINNVKAIRGPIKNSNFTGGDILWHK